MLDFLPFPIFTPTPDAKISKDLTIDPISIPAPKPTPEPTPGLDIAGAAAKSLTQDDRIAMPLDTASGASPMDPLSAAAVAGLFQKSMDSGTKLPAMTSGADGKSGDAFSQATFGDFIVNGSKSSALNTFIWAGAAILGTVLVLRLLKK